MCAGVWIDPGDKPDMPGKHPGGCLEYTGSTIPPEKRDCIFQKFYQADESHATQGNGVGLAIVKKVVELHQGQVHVGCDENSTTFTVVLLCFIDG